MKPSFVLTIVLLAALAPLASPAATPRTNTPGPASVAAQKVQVVFVHPEKFTDVRDSYPGTEKGRDAILERIHRYMVREAGKFVPNGDHLLITITDIDLAGDFEPWRGPEWDDVRVVRDIYPPRIDLSYRLTDASGRVVKEARRRLVNLAFQQEITRAFPDDSLRYEKQLIDDWLHDDFQRQRG